MEKFEQLLRKFDLNYFGKGEHKVSLEKAAELIQNDNAVFIDVRSQEELEYVSFKFAVNIPTSEIPDRLEEIPKDKMVVLFCASGPRAAIAYAYLQVKGYENVKILPNSLSEIAALFKPGYVLENL